MAPRSRLLDLERDDVLFFYGAYYQSESDSDSDSVSVSVATYGIVFWPIFLVAGLLLHIIAPFPFRFPHTAAVCGALYVAYCFLLSTARRRRPAPARGLPLPLPCRRQNEWPAQGMVAGDTTTDREEVSMIRRK